MDFRVWPHVFVIEKALDADIEISFPALVPLKFSLLTLVDDVGEGIQASSDRQSGVV